MKTRYPVTPKRETSSYQHVKEYSANDEEYFKDSTLFMVKSYKANIRPIGKKAVSHVLMAILDASVYPDLIRKDVLPKNSIPNIRKFHMSIALQVIPDSR